MTNEELQWEAQESVTLSLHYFVPLNWKGIKNAVSYLRRLTYKHNAQSLTNRPMSVEDRQFIRFWSKGLREYLWGARLAHYENGESNFYPGEIDTRLAEAGLIGAVVHAAVYKAVDLSRRWPDGPLTRGQRIRRQRDIREFLQKDMAEAWGKYAYGIVGREVPVAPVLPTFRAVMDLLDRHNYRISQAGVEFLGRALPNPQPR